ncbi:MAG: DNA polymerase IV [Candidatus Nanoarchaeia archaeon]
MRIILHIDLDAFFASVEIRDNPELKSKPVVIGADPKGGKGRGVVSTCNYEARKYGIKSGMPISIAYRKCPQCVFLPVNMPKYVNESIECQKIFKKYANKFEIGGIDEFYLDVSEKCKDYSDAIDLAKKIKTELKEKRRLTCSIGIAPNKLVAKIAANRQKPDGLTIVKEDQILNFLAPLDVDELLGVGPKTKAILNSLGVYTIKDLRNYGKEKLIEIFGKNGLVLYNEACGIDESPVLENWEPKSIGRQITFDKDTKDKKKILVTLGKLINETINDLKSQNYAYKTITVKIRYSDFFTTSKSQTLKTNQRDMATAQIIARKLILPLLKDPRPVRLIGFYVSKLIKIDNAL